MRFSTELVPARLIRRYKRFLADCELADGTVITAHCANPGSMMGLAIAGERVWLEPNDDPKKKLKYGWRLVDHENGHFTGVDTSVPNRALKDALFARQIKGLDTFDTFRAEVAYGERSRADFLMTREGAPDTWIEVKSVTLSRQPGLAEFPDSVTARGARHMGELAAMAKQGARAVILFLVQRTDCQRVTLARDIDPVYAAAFDAALVAGVEVMAIGTRISPHAIEVADRLDFTPKLWP